jgi:predicted transcriptional regulator
MIHEFTKLTIVRITKPAQTTVQNAVNDDLKWLGSSLGLFSLRDKNSSCFRVFIELLKAAKVNHPMSSDEISLRTKLSRGTVVFHLDKLISSGLVTIENSKYILRLAKLESLVDQLKSDTEKVFTNLKEIARDIDSELGL